VILAPATPAAADRVGAGAAAEDAIASVLDSGVSYTVYIRRCADPRPHSRSHRHGRAQPDQ
jgi:hypothetical protein